MICGDCRNYRSIDHICKLSGETRESLDEACEEFIHDASIFREKGTLEDSFSYMLDARYLVEGRMFSDNDSWICSLSDTEDGAFLEMFFAFFFRKTKEEAMKRFLEYVQGELAGLSTAVSEKLYELNKEAYLHLMDKD